MAHGRFALGLRNDKNEGAEGGSFKAQTASQPSNTSQKTIQIYKNTLWCTWRGSKMLNDASYLGKAEQQGVGKVPEAMHELWGVQSCAGSL
jgi:hypothetical protein